MLLLKINAPSRSEERCFDVIESRPDLILVYCVVGGVFGGVWREDHDGITGGSRGIADDLCQKGRQSEYTQRKPKSALRTFSVRRLRPVVRRSNGDEAQEPPRAMASGPALRTHSATFPAMS